MFELIKTEKNMNNGLYVLWVVSSLVIYISVIVDSRLSLLSLLLFLYVAIRRSSSDMLVLLFGLMPLANVFKLSQDTTSLFTLCQFLCIAVLIFRKKTVGIAMCFFSLLFLAYVGCVSLGNFDLFFVVKIVSGFLLIYYALPTFTKQAFKQATIMMSINTLLSFCLSLNEKYNEFVIPFFQDVDYLVDSSGKVNDLLRVSGFIGDPNYFSVLLLMSITSLTILFFYDRIKISYWILLVPMIFLGFMTYSKSYFLCIIAFVVLFVLFVLYPKNKIAAMIVLLILPLIFSFVVSGSVEAITIILGRFSSSGFTTGRTDLNDDYLKYILGNFKVLLFGDGIEVDRFVGASNNVHNIYIELLYKLGIVGTSVYLICLSSSFSGGKQSVKIQNKKHIVNFMPLMFFLVMFFFLGGIARYELPYYLILIYLGVGFSNLSERECITDKQ